MENRFWTVTYRNRDNGQRITAAVFAARSSAGAGKGSSRWPDRRPRGVGNRGVEPHEETLARVLIAEFSKKQQDGHFACPAAGR